MAITKDNNIKFYEAASRLLTKKMEQKNLSVSQVSGRGDVQFNTVKAAVSGTPFYAHQLIWMDEVLDISINDIMEEMTNEEESTIEDLI